jgi:diacylglycerol kinase (ATP)
LRFAWLNQRNFRIEVYLALVVLALAVWLDVGLVQVLILITLILGLELANTALEALVDLVSPEFHPLAKAAKDMAAGAVLTASILSALIGLILFVPPLLGKLGL